MTTYEPNDIWWSIFTTLVCAAGLSIAYWYTEKVFLPYWRSALAIMGLEIIRHLAQDYIAAMPYGWALWFLFMAIYFKATLPSQLRFWIAFFLAFVQALLVYMMGLAVMFLGIVTSPPPSVVPWERKIELIPGSSIRHPIGRDVNPVRPPSEAKASTSSEPGPEPLPVDTGTPPKEIRLQQIDTRTPQQIQSDQQAQDVPQVFRTSVLRGSGQVIQVQQ